MQKLISIDFQKEFAATTGKHYRYRPCVSFILETLVPHLRYNNVKIAEIISDYRQPRPGDPDDSTRPGQDGYRSMIADYVKHGNVWIKCMNSPIWVRDNIGNPSKKPGLPYEDPEGFTKWLNSNVGKRDEVESVVLFGLTIDCCVFSTAQELRWRGYKVEVLREAVDTFSGDQKLKELILGNPPLLNWASVVSWSELKERMHLTSPK